MKILKIFGAVMAGNALAIMLLFAIPGCSASSKPAAVSAAPAPAGPPLIVAMADPSAPAGSPVSAAPLSAPEASAPAISFDPNATAIASGERYSPTRPGTPAAATLEAQPVENVTPATTYTVGSGDSLWTVAKKNHLTVAELAAANSLTAGAKLRIGQKLIIPGKTMAGPAAPGASSFSTYTVRAGDTLAGIAKRAGTTTTALKELNSLKSDTVRGGLVLKLPAGATMPAPVAVDDAAAPAAKPPTGSVTHVVKAGETLSSIALKYQVKYSEIATANSITDPTKIRPGMTLVIPGWQAPKSARSADGASKTAAAPKPAVKAPGPEQDLDAGLKPGAPADIPVIKIEDPAGPAKSP